MKVTGKRGACVLLAGVVLGNVPALLLGLGSLALSGFAANAFVRVW